MTLSHLIVILLIHFYFILLPGFVWNKLFVKVGLNKSRAFIPFLNTWEILNLKATPKYWFFVQLIPIAGWFATINILIDFAKKIDRHSFLDSLWVSICPAYAFYQFNQSEKIVLLSDEQLKQNKKSLLRDWFDSIIYAVIFAHIVKLFVFEAFVIPTPSMEKSLMVGDYLFVTKYNYGVRIPNTPISLPFVQNTMPFTTKLRSFSEFIQIPYIRWFKTEVKRGEPVVFNFPVGDTVINRDEFQSAITYYQVLRELGKEKYEERKDEFPTVTRPVDKRDNFIKRCVGIAGDSLQIKNGIIYINGQEQVAPPFSQMNYLVETATNIFSDSYLQDTLQLNNEQIANLKIDPITQLPLTPSNLQQLKKHPQVKKITLVHNASSRELFPYNEALFPTWTENDYGPIWIPKKGATIQITKNNFDFYERIINVYEKNKIEQVNDSVFMINGTKTNSYTFQMDYFWMMGDNRHNSLDSRFWGFVPEDHVVGKPLLIWFSKNEEGIQWKRIFNRIY